MWVRNVTKTGQAFHKKPLGIDLRRLLGDLLVLAGTLILFTTALLWVKSAMAAQQNMFQPYLVSSMEVPLPLPSRTAHGGALQASGGAEQTPDPATPTPETAGALDLQSGDQATAAAAEILPSATPGASLPASATPQATPAAPLPTGLPEQGATPESPAPTATVESEPPAPGVMYPAPEVPAATPVTEAPAVPPPASSAGPVVKLVIPRLQVNRAVVPVELRRDGNGNVDWNTEALFSTPNRSDLVGQLAVSANPGEGGNIILVGHNYNNGWYDWEGVFVRLSNMQAGDVITLMTENGGEFQYIVQKVKKVPWQKRNLAELEKHQKFLWPTGHEQLTLVTCGGTVLWSWQARIYVVALPAAQPSP